MFELIWIQWFVKSGFREAVANTLEKMQNEEGQNMDLYIPRKWYNAWFSLSHSDFLLNLGILARIWWCDYWIFCSSATNRLITSKDHASVQINIGHVDENGIYTGQFSTFALCGFVRAQVLNPFSFDLFKHLFVIRCSNIVCNGFCLFSWRVVILLQFYENEAYFRFVICGMNCWNSLIWFSCDSL